MDNQWGIRICPGRYKSFYNMILNNQIQNSFELRDILSNSILMQKGTKIFQSNRYTHQKMRFPFEQPTKSICAQNLHDADEHIPIILLHKLFLFEWCSLFRFN